MFQGEKVIRFFSHAGEAAVSTTKWQYYNNRNPAWITGGIEKNGFIHWSQPEILLYHDDPAVKMSYPDFVEVDGVFHEVGDVARLRALDQESTWVIGPDGERQVCQPCIMRCGFLSVFEPPPSASAGACPR